MQGDIFVGIPNSLHDEALQSLAEARQKVYDLETMLHQRNETIMAQNKAIFLLQRRLRDATKPFIERSNA